MKRPLIRLIRRTIKENVPLREDLSYITTTVIDIMITLQGIKKGDYILTGRFKNKKVKIDYITYDIHGMPLINGKHACTFRIFREDKE